MSQASKGNKMGRKFFVSKAEATSKGQAISVACSKLHKLLDEGFLVAGEEDRFEIAMAEIADGWVFGITNVDEGPAGRRLIRADI